MALRDDGSVFFWGFDVNGKTNVPSSISNVVAIAAGWPHRLALRADGTVAGWGIDLSGVTNTIGVGAIAAGGYQSLLLKADGTATGRVVTNNLSALALGPLPPNATNLVAISSGDVHALGLHPDGSIIGWGRNSGQLDVPSFATNAVAIAAGGQISVALMSDPFECALPRVVISPRDRTVSAGTTLLLYSIGRGGLPLSYQWYRDGSPVSGQTNRWLAQFDFQPDQAGAYSVVWSNASGSVTSLVSTVAVKIPQPSISSPSIQSGEYRFTFRALRGATYIIEYKTNLDDAAWIQLEQRTGTGVDETIVDAVLPATNRFYRVRLNQ
jgi:hypothetical protein